MFHSIEKRISRSLRGRPNSSSLRSVSIKSPHEDSASTPMMTGSRETHSPQRQIVIDDHAARKLTGHTHDRSTQSSPGIQLAAPPSSDQPRTNPSSVTARDQRTLGNDVEQKPSDLITKTHSDDRQKTVGVQAIYTSSSDSESEFDWDQSDESELDENEREERRKEKTREHDDAHELDIHLRRARRLRKVYLCFMRLARPIRMALLMILGTGLAITPHILAWSIWAATAVASSCATSIFVDFLPAAVMRLIYFMYGSTPEKLKTQVELWMGVRLWTKVALNLTLYWVAILVMFSPSSPFSTEPSLGYFSWVKKFAAALFGTGIVLLVEKVLLQIIKVNFHKTSLKDRLEENKKALWALDKLAAAKDISHTPKKRATTFLNNLARRPYESGRNTPNKRNSAQTPAKMSRLKHDSPIVDVPITPITPNLDSSGQPIRDGVSAQKLQKKLQIEAEKKKKRRSTNLNHVTDQLTSAIANATLKDGNRKMTEDGLKSSTHSAKKLARKLFEGLDEDRGGVITRSEFEPFFKNASDASEAFKLFDKDGNGDIDRKEMRSAVARIYRERRALATSLKDMSSAVAKLDAVLLAVALLVSIFIWLYVFNPKGTTAQLVPMATIILGFSFVFGNAAKNLFESMLFIFSIHPYDVGDLVFIDDSPMFVLEFGLFSTTFQRVDGQVIIAPNSVLSSQKYILNVRRSGSMWETTNVMVSFDTPLEVLHEFRAKLRQYVIDNPREWKGGLDVNIDFMKNQNLIQLIVAMEHKTNWQDWCGRWDRRTMLMREMKKIMDHLNMVYKLPIQPVSFVPGGIGPRPGNIFGPNNSSSNGGSIRRGSNIGPHDNPSPDLFGNAARMGTNSEQPWNVGNIPTLRVQTTTRL